MTRHDLQKELGTEITLTWARIRRSEGTLSQDDATARQEASKILGSMIEAIEHNTCQHHDAMTCFLCANDRKQFFDCFVLHEGHSDGYSLPNRETSYRQIMAKRLQSARYLLGSPESEFRIVTDDFVWTPSDVQQASRQIVIDKLLNGIEELSTTESALVFWDGESRLPGMHLESPKVLRYHKIVDRSCEYMVLHPTFYNRPMIEGMTSTSIFACMEGSVVLTVWPGSTSNVTKIGLAWREGESVQYKGTRGLLAPSILLLEVGDMVVLPPMTIYSMIAMKASLLLNWQAIPVQMLDGSCQDMVFDRISVLHSIVQGDEESEAELASVLTDNLKIWEAFRVSHCTAGDDDDKEAKSIIERLLSFSNTLS
jgi:hypothetical protein